LSPQIVDSAGGRGGPRLFFLIGILIFLLLRSPCKIWESYDNSLLEILQMTGRGERERERERRERGERNNA
jgi:hypothetical protein